MIIKKQKLLYGGICLLFVILLAIVLFIFKVNSKKDDLSLLYSTEHVISSNVEPGSVKENEIVSFINQTDQNHSIEGSTNKESETEDRFFNELMQRDVSEATWKAEVKMKSIGASEKLKESDREMNKKWDLPDDVISKTSTDKLFLHFINSPVTSYLKLYSKPETGLKRLLSANYTLLEFYNRQNMVEGALQMLREYDLSPESMSDEKIMEIFSRNKRILENPETKMFLEPDHIVKTKITQIANNIMYADMTLLTPQFLPKLQGHEKEFLTVMLQRYEKIIELEKLYGENEYQTALSFVPQFCLIMAENLDEQFYIKLRDNKHASKEDSTKFYEEIKRYLQK